MRTRIVGVLLAAMLTTCGGCWAPKPPETSVSVNPITHTITFLDTKDNHVVVHGARYNGATHDFGLDDLEIENSASSVIQQQIQLMAQWNIQMQTANQGLRDAESAFMQGLSVI